jgi:hypothetical protein
MFYSLSDPAFGGAFSCAGRIELLFEVFCIVFDIFFPIPNIRSLLRSAIRGIDIAYGGIIISLNVPKPHSSGTRERQVLCVYIKKNEKISFVF